MKIRHLQFTTILAAFLFTTFQAQAQKKCITREDQVYTSPVIAAMVKKVGGIDNLEGHWRLGGIAGAIKRVVFSFKSEGDGFKGFVQGLDDNSSGKNWAALTICETSRTDVLHVVIRGETDSIYLAPVSTQTLRVTQISNGKVGSYYSFNKQR